MKRSGKTDSLKPACVETSKAMFLLLLQTTTPMVEEGIIPAEREEITVQIAKKEEINGIIPGKRRDETQR